MSIETFLVKYAHSLLTLGLGMAVIFLVLNWLKLHGPAFLQPIANNAGQVVSGSQFGW